MGATTRPQLAAARHLASNPPNLLLLDSAELEIEIEVDGPKIFRLARRVQTLHGVFAQRFDANERERFDNLLHQADRCLNMIIACEDKGVDTRCNMRHVYSVKEKIANILAVNDD